MAILSALPTPYYDTTHVIAPPALFFSTALLLALPPTVLSGEAVVGAAKEIQAPQVEFAPPAKSWFIESSVFYETADIVEGRRYGDDNGFFSTNHLFIKGNFLAGVWYGNAVDTPFHEIDLYTSYAYDLGETGLQVFAGYAYLDYQGGTEDDDDHEVNAGLTYNGIPYLTPKVNVRHLITQGTFIELSVASELTVTDALTLSPFVMLAINQGYISFEHDGLNNLLLGVDARYQLTENLALLAFYKYTAALDKEPGEFLVNEGWAGLGMAFTF